MLPHAFACNSPSDLMLGVSTPSPGPRDDSYLCCQELGLLHQRRAPCKSCLLTSNKPWNAELSPNAQHPHPIPSLLHPIPSPSHSLCTVQSLQPLRSFKSPPSLFQASNILAVYPTLPTSLVTLLVADSPLARTKLSPTSHIVVAVQPETQQPCHGGVCFLG